MTADFSEFCAKSATTQAHQIQVNNKVSLRVITFQPSVTIPNPIVVFVPGWISLMSTWKSVLQDMSRDFVIHYVETREKKSSVINGPVKFRVADFAQDINDLIRYLNLENDCFVLCGSSLGATAIVDTFRFLQKRPLGLALIGINAEFNIPNGWLNVVRCIPPTIYLAFKPVIKWYLRNFRLDLETDAAQYQKYCHNIDNADPFKLKKAALAFAEYTIWDRLPEIQVPTILFGASHDGLHDLENIRRIHTLLPGSHYLDLKTNSRTHSPEMVAALREFISRLSPVSRV